MPSRTSATVRRARPSASACRSAPPAAARAGRHDQVAGEQEAARPSEANTAFCTLKFAPQPAPARTPAAARCAGAATLQLRWCGSTGSRSRRGPGCTRRARARAKPQYRPPGAGSPDVRADRPSTCPARSPRIARRWPPSRSRTCSSASARTPCCSSCRCTSRRRLLHAARPSGCGKTTLLRCIAGFYEPDGGRLLFDRDDVTRVPAHRRDIGMVFQDYALSRQDRLRQRRLRAARARRRPRRAAPTGREGARRRRPAASSPAATRRNCPAASASASRWRARW